ncbi:MAG: BREX system ATP-binding domain-containing protein, partial [Dehalococcoidia bacterium]|nr:BREX system ATP-binding domain-containing protein [Dehalococcoidia bacterium]
SEAKQNLEIYPTFFTFKGEQKVKAPGLEFMFRIFKSIDFKKLAKDHGKELEAAIEAIPGDLDEVKTILRKCCFAEPDLQNKALYFLKGEINPNKTDLKQMGIIRKIDDIDIAKEYLAGILKVLKGLGFQTLLLAVDEVEYLFSLVPKPQQAIYVALLRGLYDFPVGMMNDPGEIAKVAIFLAVSSDGYRGLTEMEKSEHAIGGPTRPLFDRIDVQTNLGVLTKEDAKELITKRLHYDRVAGRYTHQPLIPFDQTFIVFIWEITKGNPRDIIDKCSHVLDAGIEMGISQLNRSTAEKLLRDRREL